MDVGIVGGGAAGMLAAATLAREGVRVELFEKNEKLGKKLYITGKGRCNLTNFCDVGTIFANIVHGEKFLRSAMYCFPPSEVMAYFEGLGVPLTVERGNRVFPTSGKSSDVIRALAKEIARLGVSVRLKSEVTKVESDGDGLKICRAEGDTHFDAVIIATGGASYPATGSTGDGYKFAKAFGHGISEPRPALVPLRTHEDISCLDGLHLKNVRLEAYREGKLIASEFGELEFISGEMSGPIALTVSSYVTRLDGVTLKLDLKPALDEATLDKRLQREFAERHGQSADSAMRALLPDKLNTYLLRCSGVDPLKKVDILSKEERKAIICVLKGLKFKLAGTAPFAEAIITSGGVSVDGLKPSGESKLQKGLYFVGETVDVDALTGGFNLQIAWATARLAALDILKSAGLES